MIDGQITLPAFAKINLSLRVLGRRADDYHEIRTTLQTISLHDRLTFSPVDDERLELLCSAPDVPTDERNLVLRAAKLLRDRFQVRRGARVELEKSIPSGGGLGGGSSDAALALLGLSRLWEIHVEREELVRIGASIGADVPFFFTGGTALATGTGTRITPLEDASRLSLLVLTPVARVATQDAYKALRAPALTKPEAAAILPISRAEADFRDSLQGVTRNDFESVVFRLQPEIERAKRALLEVGASRAMLAGSGSSVFGVFDSDERAMRARESMNTEPGWQVFSCSTLSRSEYHEALGEDGFARSSIERK